MARFGKSITLFGGGSLLLRWRIFSGTVIIAILLALVVLDFHWPLLGVGGLWLAPVGMLCVLGAVVELLGLLRAKDIRPVAWPIYLGSLAVFLTGLAPIAWQIVGITYPADCALGKLGWPLSAMAAGIGLAFVGEMIRYKEPGNVMVNVASSVFVIAYVGLLSSFLGLLRMFHSPQWGLVALLSMMIVVKFSDIGAYATGRLLGKHKLAPRLSPGKTVEGAIGGIVTACLVSWLVFTICVPSMVTDMVPTPWWGSLLYGLIIALSGMLGDLAVSLFKRDSGQKNSSDWMPGLGGVLDVLDSVLAAAPPAFVCWAVGLV